MDASKPIGVADFVKQTGVATPGYRASALVRKMQEEYRTEGNKYLREYYVHGDFNVQLDYNGERDWVKIDVWARRIPEWIYDYYFIEQPEEFRKRTTRRSNSISAQNPAKVMASVNSLYRKSQSDVEKTSILADIRRTLKSMKETGRIPEEQVKEWNIQAKEQGFFGERGLQDMNLKQTKVLKTWIDAKIKAFLAPHESLATEIVGILLEDEEPDEEGEMTLSPAELTRAIGLNYSPEEFTFEWHQDRFGRWSTGTSRLAVYWKKLLRKGKPVYLGSLRRVDRPYNNPYTEVPYEGWFYIDSVPTKSWEYRPRGARIKPGKETFKTRGGYGIVRYREMPKTYTKYFRTPTEAAGYLASLIRPHKYLKVVESEVGSFVDYLRNVSSVEVTDKDFVYKDASDPRTRHLDIDYDDGRSFDVYAKRAPTRKGIPWIGRIYVTHNEEGTPVWSLVDSPVSGPVWGTNAEAEFKSRAEAAKLLWQWFIQSKRHYKPTLPASPPPF